MRFVLWVIANMLCKPKEGSARQRIVPAGRPILRRLEHIDEDRGRKSVTHVVNEELTYGGVVADEEIPAHLGDPDATSESHKLGHIRVTSHTPIRVEIGRIRPDLTTHSFDRCL